MSRCAASAALASVRSVSLPAPLGPTTSTSRPLPSPGGACALAASDDTTALPPYPAHHRHGVREVDVDQVGATANLEHAAVDQTNGPSWRRRYSGQRLRHRYVGNTSRKLEGRLDEASWNVVRREDIEHALARQALCRHVAGVGAAPLKVRRAHQHGDSGGG